MESDLIINIILPVSLGIIMFGMGTSLVLDDFKRIFVYPKAVLIGAFGQIILLPILGYLFCLFIDLYSVADPFGFFRLNHLLALTVKQIPWP